MPEGLATGEAEVGEWLKPRSLRWQWAMIAPLHCSLSQKTTSKQNKQYNLWLKTTTILFYICIHIYKILLWARNLGAALLSDSSALHGMEWSHNVRLVAEQV